MQIEDTCNVFGTNGIDRRSGQRRRQVWCQTPRRHHINQCTKQTQTNIKLSSSASNRQSIPTASSIQIDIVLPSQGKFKYCGTGILQAQSPIRDGVEVADAAARLFKFDKGHHVLPKSLPASLQSPTSSKLRTIIHHHPMSCPPQQWCNERHHPCP